MSLSPQLARSMSGSEAVLNQSFSTPLAFFPYYYECVTVMQWNQRQILNVKVQDRPQSSSLELQRTGRWTKGHFPIILPEHVTLKQLAADK